MAELMEFEYRGLNILDEISTVEITIDPSNSLIHIFDIKQVVEPEYNFSKKYFQMSDGFQKMAQILYNKRFQETEGLTIEQWVNNMTWIFYGSKKSIIKVKDNNFMQIPKETLPAGILEHSLLEKYAGRMR